jgi:hypothetical protein
MGFNKRYITREMILEREDSELDKLFNADAFIFDSWSSRFFNLYQSGMKKDEILSVMN